MRNQARKRVVLIGLGPNMRRNYVKTLAAHCDHGALEIAGVVELTREREGVEAWIASQDGVEFLSRAPRIYVDEKALNYPALPPTVCTELEKTGAELMIISTPPETHFSYLDFAIRSDMRILVEKPITAHAEASCDCKAARALWNDYRRLEILLREHPQAHVAVMAQRRYHPGYAYVFSRLREVIAEFQLPITEIHLTYSDGQFDLAHELTRRAYHGFKHGNGILSHSGHHLIDVFARLVQLNQALPNGTLDEVQVYSQSRRPRDMARSLAGLDCARLFGRSRPPSGWTNDDALENPSGEVDCHSMFRFHQGDRLITSGTVCLSHSGFSVRTWPEPRPDLYKGNGRVRQEYLSVVISPIFRIEVRSYQAYETDRALPAEWSKEPGGLRHFEITVFHSHSSRRVETINFDNHVELTNGTLVSLGRKRLLEDFLSGDATRSDFASHRWSAFLLSLAQESLAKEYQGRTPICRSRLPSLETPHVRKIHVHPCRRRPNVLPRANRR